MPRKSSGRPIQPTTIKGRHYRVVPRQRRDGTWAWQAQVYNAELKRRQGAGTFDTAEDAVAACQRVLGVLSSGPSITVAAVQARWLDSKRGAGHERSSIRYAEHATGEFVESYGAEPANAITKAMAEQWVQAKPWHYGALQAMFNYAADRLDAIPASPFRGKRPARAKGSRRALTEPELLALADLAGERHGAWHEVLLLWKGYGGLRLAELLDTRVHYVEGRTPSGNLRVRVETQWRAEEHRSRHTKGRRDRGPHHVIIPGWVADAAAPLIEAARQREDGLIFTTPKGKRLTPQNYRLGYWYAVREAFAALLPETHWVRLKMANGKHLDLHELRHTGSTVIYNRTGDLNASRAQLGHAKESMTIRYTHPEDERGLEAVDAAYTAQVVPLRRRTAS